MGKNNHSVKPINKKKIMELREKLNTPEYLSTAIEKIAADLTHLLFRQY